MLRVIASSDVRLRDSFVRVLGLEKQEETPIATTYRKGQWIFAYLHISITPDMIHWIASTFLPERLYFPTF
jgi:hypothetical protein